VLAEPKAAKASGAANEPCGDKPRFTVQREGGRTQRIITVCTCGREIVIECDYAETVEGERP